MEAPILEGNCKCVRCGQVIHIVPPSPNVAVLRDEEGWHEFILCDECMKVIIRLFKNESKEE